MNAEDLSGALRRAQDGRISAHELDEIAARLVRGEGDAYTLLNILGAAQAIRYRDLVVRFLGCRTDPMTHALALSVLCNDWGLSADYRDEIMADLGGREWDAEDDCRLSAISVAGAHLRLNNDIVMLRELEGHSTYVSAPEGSVIAETALEGLARAVGFEWAEILGTGSRSKVSDERILERVTARLETVGK